jgi:hypothetical protein
LVAASDGGVKVSVLGETPGPKIELTTETRRHGDS